MTIGKQKSIFNNSPSKDTGLYKIISVIILIGLLVLGGFKASEWFQEKVTGHVETSAPERLADARALLEADNPTQALEELAPILERVDNASITPKALLLQIDIYKHLNQLEDIDGLYKKLIETYPQSAEYPQAAIDYARILESNGEVEASIALYQKLHDTAPPSLRAPATTALGREQERNGKTKEAYALYRTAINDAPQGSETWDEAMTYLGNLNTAMLFSQNPTSDSKVYIVQKGDSLTTIGSKLNVTQGQLLKANGLVNANTLRLNQSLKYTPKDFRIVIERSTCRILLMDGEGIFKVYHTGLGRTEKQTTLGRYKVGNKEKNPTWHKPGATPIPPGDPQNELGTRWLPLVPEEEALPTDLGIHGTIRPESIGRYSSSGCPRMHNAEVEELYDLVVRSTPVHIVEVYTPSL